MPVNILVPQLGESIVEATVAEWLKKEGEQVAVGDPVVRLETEKVDLEVGAERAGVLGRVLHGPGEDVKVGDVLGVIEETATAAGAAAPAVPGVPAAQSVRPGGDMGNEGAGAGTARPGDGGGAAQAVPAQQPPTEQAAASAPAAPGAGQIDATPVARRMAEELGIDIARVPGSGPKGKITKEDVEGYAGHTVTAEAVEAPEPEAPKAAAQPQPSLAQPATPRYEAQPAPEAPTAGAPMAATPVPSDERRGGPSVAAPAPAEGRREVRERMSRRRQTIARRLVEAQQTAAMLTTFNEIDMRAVMDVRARRRDAFKERHGIGLGFMSFFVKATIGALKAFPRVNAEIQGSEIVLKQYYDIGIAVGSEEGLVVPVLRDADRLSFAEIEREIKTFADKAQQGTLTLEDLRGGTFTITNGGVFGSLLSTPILNPPQVGILGMHKIEDRPVAVGGQVEVRPMMYVALTYDHRIVDGREAVQFLVRVKELVEDPERLLLEG